MSLFESLYTGVSGMNAQSRSTAIISENIANLNTVGYKKSEAAFRDIVADGIRRDQFGSGGVYSERIQRVDIQGQIQQTQSTTEAAISGAGFFVVKTNPIAEAEFLFTRNGAFSEDANGILRNSAGFALYGIPTSATGITTAAGATLDSLQPVDVDELNAVPIPTTQATQIINLDGNETSINPQLLNGGQALPVTSQSTWDAINNISIDTSAPPSFVRNQTVYDGNGTARDLIFEYRKIIGPMAHFTGARSQLDRNASMTDGSITPGINAGDTLTLSDGTNTLNVNFVNTTANLALNEANTVQDMINVVNQFTDGGGARVFDAGLDDEGRFIVRAFNPTATIDLAGTSAGILGTSGLNIINDPVTGTTIYGPKADITGSNPTYPNQGDFPPLDNTTTPNTRGWWEVRVMIEPDPAISSPTLPDPNNPNLTIPNPNYDPNNILFGQNRELSKGLINFDGNGVLNVTRDPATNQALDGIITLSNIDFDSATAGEEISVDVDIGRFQQFAGAYNVTFTDQDGAAPGTLTGVSINRQGDVIATFSNGTQRAVYRIPLANFINPNGLNDVSGTVFKATTDAGVVELLDPGTGGAGLILGSAIENSNVDLADEFANLIVTQRAFSANSQVVSTIDEMTEQLRALKR